MKDFLDFIFGLFAGGGNKTPELNFDYLIANEWNQYTKATLVKTIKKLTKGSRRYKIGKTGDPERRVFGYKGQYKRMYVLFCTDIPHEASECEAYCIGKFIHESDNQRGGSAGANSSTHGIHYVYLVCK